MARASGKICPSLAVYPFLLSSFISTPSQCWIYVRKATLVNVVLIASYRKKRSHQLRYVLRNKTTKQVYLVILFTLYLKEDVNEDGSLKPEAAQAYASQAPTPLDGQASLSEGKDYEFDSDTALQEAEKQLSDVHLSQEEKGKAVAQNDDID